MLLVSDESLVQWLSFFLTMATIKELVSYRSSVEKIAHVSLGCGMHVLLISRVAVVLCVWYHCVSCIMESTKSY